MIVKTLGVCEHCHTPLAATSAPIWEIYCPNMKCTVDRDRMFADIRTQTRAAIALRDAAPDLLEALTRLFHHWMTPPGEPIDADIEALERQVRAALAKANARGEA